jgi:peptide/nickel transport system permease protein
MTSFLLNRLFQAGLVLLIMSFLIYVLIGLMPGDPIDIMIAGNPEATAQDIIRLKQLYGLDQPLTERYFTWLGQVLGGDLGYSRLYSTPVLDILWPRMAATLLLMGCSLILTLLIALPLGIYAAKKPHGFSDNLINLISFAGISIPPFWLALMMITLFSVILGWLPASGFSILPVLALTLGSVGGYTRHMRSAMIDVLQKDYIRTARAKGCSEIRVILKHGLQSALIPVTTLLALDLGALFGGALITETIFAYPGQGKLIYDAIMGNDYNLALSGLLCVTFMILMASFIVDLVYMMLNPNLSLTQEKTS